MATVFYSTEAFLDGPWLLTRTQLLELDARFDKHMERLKTTIDGPTFDSLKRFVSVKAGEDIQIVAATFAEAEQELTKVKAPPAKEFSYIISQGDEVLLSVMLMTAEGKKTGDTVLSIVAQPADKPEVHATFQELIRWSEGARLPTRERYFEKYGGWVTVPLALVMFLAGTPTESAPVNHYKIAAKQMLTSDGGYTEEQAIRLLLSIASDAPAPLGAPVVKAEASEQPPWYWALDIWFCLATVFLMISPTRLVGLGRGEQLVDRWTFARKVFVYTVPSIAIGWLALPRLQHLLGIGP